MKKNSDVAGTTLNKIRMTKSKREPVAKSFRLHPDVAKLFDQQAKKEGHKQVDMAHKCIIFYLNHGGEDCKIP